MKWINIHTHSNNDALDGIAIINQYPNTFIQNKQRYFSIGIHPWYIDDACIDEELQVIEEKIQLSNVLAIGECGLDKRRVTPLKTQTAVFEAQLLLAEQYKKPVIIHCVAAFEELIMIKQKLNITVPMVIHGFSKSYELAQQLIKQGFYLSFGKHLLNNPNLQVAFQSIPNDRFFLETDSMVEGIDQVFALAAQYKNIDVVSLQHIITKNFNTIFKNGRVDRES